jgi:hypothetical protein
MKSIENKLISSIALLALLLMTFGITYLDFEDLSLKNNIRPYLEILVGLIAGVYLFYVKRKNKSSIK